MDFLNWNILWATEPRYSSVGFPLWTSQDLNRAPVDYLKNWTTSLKNWMTLWIISWRLCNFQAECRGSRPQPLHVQSIPRAGSLKHNAFWSLQQEGQGKGWQIYVLKTTGTVAEGKQSGHLVQHLPCHIFLSKREGRFWYWTSLPTVMEALPRSPSEVLGGKGSPGNLLLWLGLCPSSSSGCTTAELVFTWTQVSLATLSVGQGLLNLHSWQWGET